MLILPKVYPFRTLSSFSRVLNPSNSTASSSSPSISSSTSSGPAGHSHHHHRHHQQHANVHLDYSSPSQHVIGGGGPFTSNAFLLGGGALTKIDNRPGTSLDVGDWAPRMGGRGGAGRKKKDQNDSKGHGIPLIGSTSSSSDPSSVLDEDDCQTYNSIFAKIRQANSDAAVVPPTSSSQFGPVSRSTPILPTIISAHRADPIEIRTVDTLEESLISTSTSTIRTNPPRSASETMLRLPEVQRKLRSAFSQTSENKSAMARAHRRPSRLRRLSGTETVINKLEPTMNRQEASTEQPTETTELNSRAPEVNVRSRSPLRAPAKPRVRSSSFPSTILLTPRLDFTSVPLLRRSHSLSTSSKYRTPSAGESDPELSPPSVVINDEGDAVVLDSFNFDASEQTSQPLFSSPAHTDNQPIQPISQTDPLNLSQAHAVISSTSSLQPAPGMENVKEDGAPWEIVLLPPIQRPTSTNMDPAEHYFQNALINAMDARDERAFRLAADAYWDSQTLPFGSDHSNVPLPKLTVETINLILDGLRQLRPPGAPIDEIKQTFKRMLNADIPPDPITYLTLLETLFDRELEISDALVFQKRCGEIRPGSFLAHPPALNFKQQRPLESLVREFNLPQAMDIFFAASRFYVENKKVFPRFLYGKAAEALGRSTNVSRLATSLYKEIRWLMSKDIIPTSGFISTQIYTGLLSAFFNDRKLDSAAQLLVDFVDDDINGRIGWIAEDEEGRAEERIMFWNRYIEGHFQTGRVNGAMQLVQNLLDGCISPQTSVAPAIRASTLNVVIKQLLDRNDVTSALYWFDDFLPDSPKKHPSTPQLTHQAYEHFLVHAIKKGDWALYDKTLFAALTFSPAGFQPRPVDISQGIQIHLLQIHPDSTLETMVKHADRILGLITKCEQYRQLEYLLPPNLSPILLALLVKVKKTTVFEDVYRRSILHFGPDSTEAFRFQDRIFANIVHDLTTEGGVFVEYTDKEKLDLLGTLVRIGVSLDVPLDVSHPGVAERVLGLYSKAVQDVDGRLDKLGLSASTVWAITECASVQDVRSTFPQTGQANNTIGFVSALINARRATGMTYQINWASAARTLTECHGVEYASRLLALLGPDVLQLLGLPPLRVYGSGAAYVPSADMAPNLTNQTEPAAATEQSQDTVSAVDATLVSEAGRPVALETELPEAVSPLETSEGQSSAPISLNEQTASGPAPVVVATSTPLQATAAPFVPGSSVASASSSSSLFASTQDSAESSAERSRESTIPTFDTPNADLSRRTFFVDSNLTRVINLHRVSSAKVTPVQSYQALRAGMAKNLVAHHICLTHLVEALGRAKELEKMVEVLELAHHVLFLTKPDDLDSWVKIESNAIIAFAHCGEMERAAFHRTNIIQAGGAPSADAYAALVNGAKDTTDDAAVARALFRESKELNVKPTLFLYNTIISSLSKARKAEEAIALFYEVKEVGLSPSTVTYGAVINACCRVGNSERAIALFDEMTSQSNFKPRVHPYKYVLFHPIYLSFRRLLQTHYWSLFSRPDSTMMQYFITSHPDRERVLYYYDELLKANISPTSHTYNLLMQAYGSIEPVDLRAMHKVFEALIQAPTADARLEGIHWATLINCHGNVNRDLDTALEIFDSITQRTANAPTFGKRQSPVLPDAVCWEALFNAVLMHKRFDVLEKYLDRMIANGAKTTTYIQNVLIKGFASENQIERARAIFERMQDPAMGMCFLAFHVFLIPSLSGFEARPGSPWILLIGTMIGIAANSTEVPAGVVYRMPSTYETMVRAELGFGERHRAVELCERMEARLFPPSVMTHVRSLIAGTPSAGSSNSEPLA
ncbi:FOG: PPR repeat [Phaffia rhodozyma]|uniref:FOG: PPR repeat n=1 Tax=Phaffia rhodozyma TaxID=264483 RepID=A0A0F7SXK4_PHARH|nr:FOG: PPR repeat [Phaffia rhodozyma]